MDLPELLEQPRVKKLIEAFDLLPDILFWVKDPEGRVLYGNEEFVKHQGYKHLQQVVNKTDYDLAPQHLAHQYVIDDKRVLAGHQVNGRLELNYTSSGELSWFSTSKRALVDEVGEVVGTYGVTRQFQGMSKTLVKINAIEVPVNYIREHYQDAITIEKLADLAHLSISAFERRFKKCLGKTPNQFINETRLENARRMLVETNLPISTVAFKCGFPDHSYFSRQFQLLFGETPSQLRKNLKVVSIGN